jgi:hypothetical protein
MHLLYNSDSYAVLQFDLPGSPATAGDGAAAGAGPAAATAVLAVTGFEIVDKFARREVFLQGALAERFRAGVQSLVESEPTQDQFDEFIAGFTAAGPQPVVLH